LLYVARRASGVDSLLLDRQSRTMAEGKFITLEGGEGAGKSTQVRLLCAALEERGVKAIVTREPGGTPGAEAVRDLLLHGAEDGWSPMTESLLHFAARREHLDKKVLPALSRGSWVVSDRFADSTMAYQGYGQGLGREPIEALYRIVVGAFEPDLTLILDLPVEEGLARADGRRTGKDRYERMDRDFHERLRHGFLEIARLAPSRCRVIDARMDTEKVHHAIMGAVDSCFGLSAA
jgi:dTMP kinase